MKKTMTTGKLKTQPITSILRPWVIFYDGKTFIIIPTDLIKLRLFQKIRNDIRQERFTVVTVSETEHYVVKWNKGQKTLAGEICADSFGNILFKNEEHATDILLWHQIWDKKNNNPQYYIIAEKIKNREKEQLKFI